MNVPAAFSAFQYRQTPDGPKGSVVVMPMSEIGDGDCLIRVTHSSVNYKDGLAATGRAGIIRRFPLVGGADAVGAVVEPGASGLVKEGDRVVVTGCTLSETHNGGYGEYLRVPADWVTVIPDSLTLLDAATYGTAGVAAARAVLRLEDAGVRPPDGPIAVTGASGGAGGFVVAMLAGLGYEVHAFSSKPQARERLLSYGAAVVEPRPDVAFTGESIQEESWAGAIDPVGGETLAWLIRTTRSNGSIVSFGHADSSDLHTSVLPFIYRAISLLGSNITWLTADLRNRIWTRLATDLHAAPVNNLRETISFADLPRALEDILITSAASRTVVEISV